VNKENKISLIFREKTADQALLSQLNADVGQGLIGGNGLEGKRMRGMAETDRR